jgi:dTDP-4-amino-4,6-dideoxygalactose transaminase
MKILALNGGSPVHQAGWPAWPIFDHREEKALLRVLHSGKWWLNSMDESTQYIDSGRIPESEVGNFEINFPKVHDCTYGVCAANGTVTLEVALRAVGIKPGDEVIVPPYTFIATAIAPLMIGAVPVFVDIEPDTCNIDPQKIEKAITKQTKAIIPVHFAGRPANMDEILAIAKKYGLFVIEDSAHAHGASYGGHKCGSLGDMGSFSFQGSKNITAGEGGIMTTNNREFADLARSFVWGGRTAGSSWYGHDNMGSNLRMTEFQAAILSVQLEHLAKWFATREKNGAFLDQCLTGIKGVRPMARLANGSTHAYHLYLFRYDPISFGGLSKEKFIQALQAEGLEVSGGYGYPLYKNKVFLDARFWGNSYPFIPGVYDEKPNYARYEELCPICESSCFKEIIWIPQNCLLAEKESIQSIAAAIEKVLLHHRELI